MASSPLVTTAWLEDHLADPDLRIVEVCSLRDDKTYHEGHIPGRDVGLLEVGVLARHRSRFRHAGGDGQAVRRHGHRPALDRRALRRSGSVRQLRVLGVHHGRAQEPAAARRRPPQMGHGRAADVAERAALSARSTIRRRRETRRCGSAGATC